YNNAITNTTTPTTTYLEIGPGNTLTTLTKRIVGNAAIASLPHREDTRSASETMRRALGALWTTGARPDWGRSTGGGRRIALPGYAFQLKSFWLDKRTPTVEDDRRGERREEMAEWFAVPSWQHNPLPTNPGPDAGKHWLVFADGGGLGDALARRLRAAGATVTTVVAGDEWRMDPGGRCAVDPGRAADYDRLLTALRDEAGDAPTHVVHAWCADDPGDGPDAELVADRRGFGSLMLFAQAWSRAGGGTRRLWLLTTGLHAVTGAERMHPSTATVLGPARVLPREMPGLACRVVDVEPDCPAHADRVFAELGAEPDSGTQEVALRGARRWALHHVPHPMAPHDGPPPIRPDGVYLVTGGTGGLGLALTAHLVGAGAKVVVTARTPLPPEPEWAGSSHAAARELARLRAGGAEILVTTADAADPVAMRAAVDAAVRRWGRLHGAFHVAGVAGGGVVALKDLADAAAVLRPKVRGTLVLEQALADQELDFLVLFGSNGANVANAGQADYCAANCFLDAFAQDRGRRGRVVTVDWGSWKGVGMAVTTALPSGVERARRRDVENRGMSVAEGLRALDTVLAGTAEPQVIVSPVPLPDLLAAAAAPQTRAEERRTAVRPRAAEPAQAEQVVCGVWQDLLGVERVGPQDSFFDLGGNSLVAIQLVGAVNEALGSRLSLGDLYEGLTPAHLARLAAPPAEDEDAVPDGRRRAESMRKRRAHQQRRRTARGQA
ncbi:acyl transferase domain-containing protein, partial [Saccharothrix tamanrassetensis]